jgi:fermentation-respiration switch protein FrsA (DUF1100 family)
LKYSHLVKQGGGSGVIKLKKENGILVGVRNLILGLNIPDHPAAQKTFKQFNPINYIYKWNIPIMIVQGGRDYRVPIEQGLQAFQAAQIKGIKSKLLYLPDENYWVLSAQITCMAA